jgi:hypothetical protein
LRIILVWDWRTKTLKVFSYKACLLNISKSEFCPTVIGRLVCLMGIPGHHFSVKRIVASYTKFYTID